MVPCNLLIIGRHHKTHKGEPEMPGYKIGSDKKKNTRSQFSGGQLLAATEREVCADGDSASGDLASVVQKNVHYEHYSTVPSQGTCGTYWNLDLVKKNNNNSYTQVWFGCPTFKCSEEYFLSCFLVENTQILFLHNKLLCLKLLSSKLCIKNKQTFFFLIMNSCERDDSCDLSSNC